jgi:hypothetical protein
MGISSFYDKGLFSKEDTNDICMHNVSLYIYGHLFPLYEVLFSNKDTNDIDKHEIIYKYCKPTIYVFLYKDE